MAAFLIIYTLLGAALLIGLAIYQAIRKETYGINFAIEIAFLHPPLLLLMVLLWPIAILVVILYYFMPDEPDEEDKSSEEDHHRGKMQDE